ncbi:molecular chaperone [Pseudomonas sp. NPDC089406]|uniref:fimbrial biogenesis chaperone n=1 Tax=Pseudomonas sp. NPDC089406 TaxID=3364463 RepID=UPI00384C8192
MPGLTLPAARLRHALGIGAALLLSLSTSASHAALTLNNTRVVFDSDKRSTAVVIRNPSKATYAVQAWVNTEADADTVSVPFLPSPQLFRLAPDKEQQVQITLLPNDLPTDRESLFYFNVQEIPQVDASAKNALSIALRTRIKLFYRPHQLEGSPTRQLKSLVFSLVNEQGAPALRVENPTPFHITFSRMEVSGNGQYATPQATDMLAPHSSLVYPLPGIRPAPDLQVLFSIINDYGGHSAPVTLPIALPR